MLGSSHARLQRTATHPHARHRCWLRSGRGGIVRCRLASLGRSGTPGLCRYCCSRLHTRARHLLLLVVPSSIGRARLARLLWRLAGLRRGDTGLRSLQAPM